MDLVTQIHRFIENPFPLWETTLTNELIKHKWRELEKKGHRTFRNYSTAGFWLGNTAFEMGKKNEVVETTLSVEMPSFQLESFYNEHGLELLTENEIEADGTLMKLKNAISLLQLIEPIYGCITHLVRSIHMLRQPDAEFDVSYSHPEIPFSIFVSICQDDSEISNLRVAESILHEAMHLKLTLMENILPLIQLNTSSTFYSPWRDEERPVSGVLHGLFVFTAIREFYKGLFNKLPEAANYIYARITQINKEIALLKKFATSSGLTVQGASLVINLLPLS